jgi:hypothetical protein
VKKIVQKVTFILLFCPVFVLAEWSVVTHTNTNDNTETQVARIKNEEGYTLEIYKDNNGAIRSRFSLSTKLDKFAKKSCPTYQIGRFTLDNRSVNDAPCLTDVSWSEFILGYEENSIVSSKKLNAFLNGNNVTFRFMLDNGSYQETLFSLSGSKRAVLSSFGSGVTIDSN